jgi:site-specific recombinase XerD
MIRAVTRHERKRQPRTSSKGSKVLTIHSAVKSFVGYLEGSGKAAHTIRSYRSDLASFTQYLKSGLAQGPVAFHKLTLDDLKSYQEYLGAQGFKTNTRRRKVLTIRKLLKFLTARNKLELDAGGKIPAPHKIERIPQTLTYSAIIERIRALPADSPHQARNRALLWTLAETGCQVSEVTQIRFEDYTADGLLLKGKSARAVPISHDLRQELAQLQAVSRQSPYVFLGFNKFGPLKLPISPRGVEILVKSHASLLGSDERLTPRMLRHSAVLHWHQQGVSREEIRKRLGLKTDYAFRVYDSLFRSSSKTTSSGETIPRES